MKPRPIISIGLVVAVITAAALLVDASQPVPAQAASVEGTWTATDMGDGSRMRLWVRADKDIEGLYDLRYFDQACGGCAGLPGTGRFIGLAAEENHIHGIGYFRSQGYTYFYQLEGDWFYDPVTDTITESLAGGWTTWYRAAGD